VTPRERVRMALTCRKPDRIPKALGFFPQELTQTRPAPTDEFFNLDIRYVEFAPPRSQLTFKTYLERLPAHFHIGSLSQLRTYHEWNYHPEKEGKRLLEHVRSLAEFVDRILPDHGDSGRYGHLPDQVGQWHKEGFAVAGMPPHLGGDLFEPAYRLRGFETFLEDLLIRKDLARYLLDQLTAMLIHSVVLLAQAGVDILLLDDDMAMPNQLILSPALWREHFKPRLAKVIQTVREVSPEILVFYHSDGNFTRLLPDLVEIGVNVINPVQPDCMNAEAIQSEFGNKLALWGTVGTALLWDRGTPGQIRKEVKRRIEALGSKGLLLSPAYDIDFTPFENIVAFVETIEEFG
jgi:uroporphyrinogen decarboxylase